MKNIKKLFQLLDSWKWYYGVATLLLILSTFVRTLEPKILQIAFDGVISHGNEAGQNTYTPPDFFTAFLYQLLPIANNSNSLQLLLQLVVLLVMVALVRGLSMFLSGVITAYCTENAIQSLRNRLFSHLQHLPLTFFNQISTGEIIQRCTGDIETIKKFIGAQIIDCLLLVVLLIFSFSMIWQINSTLAFVSICLIPLIFYTTFTFGKREGALWEAHELEQDKLTAIAEENLSGVRVVKAFAQESTEIAKFDAQNHRKLDIGFKHVMLHARFWPISDWMLHLQASIALVAGGYFTLLNQITVGEFVAYYTYAMTVTFPMQRLGRIVSEMGMAIVAMDRLSNILDAQEEDYSGIMPERALLGHIVFKDVSFAYQQELVLDKVSFEVRAGEKVAFLGTTGAGKSTIVALLLRFYEPHSGEILLDNIPLQQYNKTYLRERMGVVLQKTFLFSTTIAKNIAYTRPTINYDEIIPVAKAASIHEVMDIFSDGYDTMVGEKGVTLSGGQKQRVALARTLLEQPDLLILDDTTSAVDTETEFAIQTALQEHFKGKTSLVIANRIAAIQDSDQIIVLEKGKIVQQGKHDSLIQQDGFYRDVYEVQQKL